MVQYGKRWTTDEVRTHDKLEKEGKTVQEIAKALERSEGSVWALRQRQVHRQLNQQTAPTKKASAKGIRDGFKNRKPFSGSKISADDVCPICKRAPTRGRVCWPCSVVTAHLKAIKGGDVSQ